MYEAACDFDAQTLGRLLSAISRPLIAREKHLRTAFDTCYDFLPKAYVSLEVRDPPVKYLNRP